MFRNPSKRQRDYEEPTAYCEDLVRENKKQRSLPLRSPRTPGRRANLLDTNQQNGLSAYAASALTPIQSPNDENPHSRSFFSASTSGDRQHLGGSHNLGPDYDMSMDMDASENSGLTTRDIPGEQPHSARYGATLKPCLQQHNLSASPDRIDYSPDMHGEPPEDALWWRRSRLLSPVSDNGDGVAGNKDTSDDAEMIDDVSPPESLSATGSRTSSGVESEAADVRDRLSSLDLPDRASTGPTPTNKPFKKLGFSMGYRADCDKCRRRVPGHYSHIITS